MNETVPFANAEQIFTVASRSVSEGTYVRVGTEVVRLVIDGALKLKVAVPERFVEQVQLDQPVEVSTAAMTEPVKGTVSRINPVISVETRTFEVEIWIDNSEHRLKPGGFAKASIIVEADAGDGRSARSHYNKRHHQAVSFER
ncbi:MAG: efflux RND transporter periplasmic adaptor subunit [Pirellulaceae bacterium]